MWTYECETCTRDFGSQQAANQHMDALGHWEPRIECDSCYATFPTQEQVDDHMDDYDHWLRRFECETCTSRFKTQNACNQHMNATDHWAPTFDCETCTRTFASQNAANSHMNATGHWTPRFKCDVCDLKFQTQNGALGHMNSQMHHSHLYCRDCSRGFQNENNLKMHLNSKIHRGTTVPCPFCKVGFTTASGLSHHLETGSCPNAKTLDREKIYKAIRQRDSHGIFTKNLLTFQESDVETIATGAAFNGSSYECYLCHREFNSLRGLNQHLNSPTHSQSLYHCPNRSCARDFVSLASMFNHLESESCSFIRFEKVQENVQNIITGRQRLLGFA
ncbi:hypothetical protein IQ07DRAFT_543416 [Pyrenochaeta sp. DS3sAY3a]|nr:hypothetical protein IQ07DRAFT_543416 [Pyrenochaeta sp. DS3sAY3a]